MGFKITCISDTHAQHRKVKIDKCDLLIHAGDISNMGALSEVSDFINWFANQDATYKVFCCGNHDWSFMDSRKSKIRELLIQHPEITYLQDESTVINGINIYGSPWTPTFYNWAFNSDRGEQIAKVWSRIPENTDILIVHGPPFGYGDRIAGSTERVGCHDLLQRLTEVKPKICVYGHIHEGYGMYTLKVPPVGTLGFNTDVTLINASVLDEQYFIAHDPVVFEYEDFV